MAHEIVMVNDKAPMGFIGTTPWHGLGQQLTPDSSIQDWTREAGFDWSALTSVPQFVRADGSVGYCNDKAVIYRSDTGAPISIMGDRYQLVQPRAVLGFFESLIKDHGMKLATAGVLFGGRKMWALARNGHVGEVVKGDKVRQFLMLATSLDGSTPTVAAFTAIRIVCANTLALALADSRRAEAKAVRVTHRTTFSGDAVKEKMGLAGATFANFMEQARALADRPCSLEEARDILRGIFGAPVNSRRAADEAAEAVAKAAKLAPLPASVTDGPSMMAHLLQGSHTPKGPEQATELEKILAKGSEREQKSVARVLALFNGEGRGADHPGVKGTRWGLLNAVTEHVDHEMGRTADARLDNAWFGRGDDFKQAAFSALNK